MSVRWVGMSAEYTHFEVLPAGAELPEGAVSNDGGDVLRMPALVIRYPSDALMIEGELAELTWLLRKALTDAERHGEQAAEQVNVLNEAAGSVRILAQLDADDIECALVTLADLWAGTDEDQVAQGLSPRQAQVAERVHRLSRTSRAGE